MKHWPKTPAGYELDGHTLTRRRSTWTLRTASGSTHILGQRASFDEAEAIICAESS